MRVVGPEGPVLRAALAGRRRAFTDRNLSLAALAAPAVALKTIAAIHWHALRLLAKGATYRGPDAPAIGSVSPGSVKAPQPRQPANSASR